MSKKQQPSIKRKKPYGAIAAIAAAAVVLAVMPGLARKEQNAAGEISSFEARGGVIETSVHAGGTLTDRQAVAVTIPEDIELEILVKNGQNVSEGELIARADKTEVMQAAAELQKKLDEIDKEIDEAMDESDNSKLTASASGRVKAIYAQEGQSVTDAMYRNGAVALLSLDGHMAVDVYYPLATVGMQVDVTLADDEVVTGTVAALSGDNVTVTVPDTKGELDEKIVVSEKNGKVIGEGRLYIYSQLSVTGYYGTIDSLRVDVNDWVDAGDVIATLGDIDKSAGYAGLLNHRRNMEEQLQYLFEVYHNGGITAESAGIIAEVNEKDFEISDTASSGWHVSPMANSPTGSEGFTNYAAKVTGISGSTLNLMICPIAIRELDYSSAAMLESLPYTETLNYDLPEGTAIYSFVDGAWTGGSIAVGNYVVFAFNITDEGSQLVWMVSHNPVPEEPEVSDGDVTPDEPEVSDSDVSDSDVPQEPGSTTPVIPGFPNFPGGFVVPEFDYSFGDYTGAFNGMMPQTALPEENPWLLKELDVCSITADTDMTVTLAIDEKDLGHLSLGMEVMLELDAMPEETFTAVVISISDSSETAVGSAKYLTEVTVERTESMRAGMNAAVTIPVEKREVDCAVPLAALTEQNGETIVYTAYNEEEALFENPVTVVTGISDGNMVEIVSGISAGDTVYYEYVEVMDYSFI